MKNKRILKENGITLVALVVTIIILLVLAGIAIGTLKNKGLLKKADFAKEETNKSNAVETMNLKITNIQISSYTEGQKLPTLQYLADKLCEDNDMEYVLLESKKEASLEKINVGKSNSIYTKLKEYPYEFEINNNLQLASINGVKIAYDNGEDTASNSETFEAINFDVKEEKPGLKVNINPVFKEGKSKDDTYLFILIVNGKCVAYSENYEFGYNGFKENTTFKLEVLAIDKNGNICRNSKEYKTGGYTYTKKLLEFPIITAKGVCNVRVECNQDDSKSYYTFDRTMGSTTNPDSIPIESYDGDINTYAGPYNIKYKYLSIDSSAIGKKITIKGEKYQWYKLAKYSTYETISGYRDTRDKSITLTIPSGAEQYLFCCYGNEDACFYEITVSD